ncbi:MAG TPA: hypothetical protein VNY80_04360 [Steroidobacteraceae bacterium]|nr:hypothetical protein [Steroidobacteraceae bacterium]
MSADGDLANGRLTKEIDAVHVYFYGSDVMFCPAMNRHRTRILELALLLVLLLPLQGFATALSCGSFDAAPAAAQHCAHGSAAVQHHHCGTCCSAAIVVTPLHWAPPRATRPDVSLPLLISPALVALDRLDRPPRLAA